MRIEDVKRHFEVEVRWKGFPLHPEIPAQGLPLKDLFRGRDVDIPAIQARLKRTAAELNLPWVGLEMTYNTRLAQEAGKWAEEKGKGEEYHQAVFHAYFVEGKNIGDPVVLAALAENLGLPSDEALEMLQSRKFRPAVDEDWALSRDCFITAVPTFMIDQDRLVGAQPYSLLEQFMRKHAVPEK